MSGHSKWATIKRAKGSADAKRGALFTKLSKNISIAAKKGKDAAVNPTLRTAIDAARAANMTKDVIERAILRGAGELPGQQIEEVVYEGYAPGGVALLIHTATDNTNRTSSFMKSTLSKFGGNLGGPGSVSYLFKQRALVRSNNTSEALQLAAVESGAEDIVDEDSGLTIYGVPSSLAALKQAVGDAIEFAEVGFVPETAIPVTDPAQRSKLEQLLEALEDNDDVIAVVHNAKF
jgi:YebC/PmpR family DNA-binding regulatory protein